LIFPAASSKQLRLFNTSCPVEANIQLTPVILEVHGVIRGRLCRP